MRADLAGIAIVLMVGVAPACSAGAPPSADAGLRLDANCSAACDDGLYCNGLERCDPASADADGRGCARGSPPCSAACDELLDRCRTECADADGDGVPDASCGGTDCDDARSDVHPGATESCDADRVDEDCDPSTFGTRDSDGDGYVSRTCCNGSNCGPDCDDARPGSHPTAPEVCDQADNDCDEATDEGVLQTFVIDADGDGFGSADPSATHAQSCGPPTGFSFTHDDCDDTPGVGRGINPSATEQCDVAMADENCDGQHNEGCGCPVAGQSRACCAGRGTQTCQMTATGSVWSDCSITSATESCNGIDDDCDGAIDDDPPSGPICSVSGQSCMGALCQCPAGQSTCGTRCQDLTGTCTNGLPSYCARSGGWECAGDDRTCHLTSPPSWPGSATWLGNNPALLTDASCSYVQGTSRMSVDNGASRTGCYLTFGPYVSLPRGLYRADWAFRYDAGVPSYYNVRLEITADAGARSISTQTVNACSAGGCRSTIYNSYFEIREDCATQVELRVFYQNSNTLSAGYFYLDSIAVVSR